MTRSVLISGARGFLGSHCRRVFAKAGWRVVALDRSHADPKNLPATGEEEVGYRLDIRSIDDLERILRRERPTHCVQLATPSSVPQSFRNPVEDLEGHLLPTFSLFDAIRRSGLDVAVLLVSSAAVYGSPATGSLVVRPGPESSVQPGYRSAPRGSRSLVGCSGSRHHGRLSLGGSGR